MESAPKRPWIRRTTGCVQHDSCGAEEVRLVQAAEGVKVVSTAKK